MKNIYLGIDVGSVSMNIAAVDDNTEVVFKLYTRTNGQPLEVIKEGLKTLKEAMPPGFKVGGVGTTGSGRQLAGVVVGADIVKNEITAHATATTFFIPEARTIFEIGGQDSKLIILENGIVTDFAMNTVCAAGTGSFLDHQSERLGIPIEEFGDMALKARESVRIAGRCTVFAESDMIAKQQFGFSKADIINGLCEALVRNYINNLGRGKKFKPVYVFQGGVAANKGIKAAFEREINDRVIVPEYYNVMGAIGVAILARDFIKENGKTTTFRGLDAVDFEFQPSTFECSGCSNHCEVIKVEVDKRTIAMWGDRCGKWTNSIGTIK